MTRVLVIGAGGVFGSRLAKGLLRGQPRFLSRLSSPRDGGRVVESFGPFAFDLILTPEAGRLIYRVGGWRLLGVPMPRAWAPTTATHEQIDAEGRFAFDVEIGLPIAGRMVRYRGWLEAV